MIKDENERLEQMNRDLQSQLADMRVRLSKAERLYREKESETKSTDDDSNSKQQIRNLEQLLEESKEENNKRVADTSAVRQMKTIMQTQANKIKDLTRKLQRYEPDNSKYEDDD